MTHTDPEAMHFRRSLRRNGTDAEQRLWAILRNGHAGAKFRRQHPVGPYILDFYSSKHRLAIELDGGQHFEEDGKERDARRTAFLERSGIRVVRFTNIEGLKETEGVVEAIREAIGFDDD